MGSTTASPTIRLALWVIAGAVVVGAVLSWLLPWTLGRVLTVYSYLSQPFEPCYSYLPANVERPHMIGQRWDPGAGDIKCIYHHAGGTAVTYFRQMK